MNKYLHIICFDIPYPPNYGGAIDVFWKLKALHEQGCSIILHCFEYGRGRAEKELEDLCLEIHLYERNMNWLQLFKKTPFIVQSRANEKLLDRLLEDDHPILLEGIHCSWIIQHPMFVNRSFYLRMANLESQYYLGLAKASSNLIKKVYYALESSKLYGYQKQLQRCRKILAISPHEQRYLGLEYGEMVEYLPAFHGNEWITPSKRGKGDFLLYHGNLSVEENEKACIYLIENVFSNLDIQVKIAGRGASNKLQVLMKRYAHIDWIDDPSDDLLDELVTAAFCHVLYTHQETGLKLKLLKVLYKGAMVVGNSKLVSGTDLDDVMTVLDDPQDMIRFLRAIQVLPEPIDYQKRKDVLDAEFSNERNVQKLLSII